MTRIIHHFSRISAMTFALAMMAPAVLAPMAHAQFSANGDDVIKIAADTATYKGRTTELNGNVTVTQGPSNIRADRMTIFREQKTAKDGVAIELGEITRIVAYGDFSYISPENTVTGDKGIYKRKNKEIEITGDVLLKRPTGATVSGEQLFYDLENGRARFKDEENKSGVKKRIDFSINNGG